jgi:hypothetical protein
MSPLVLIGLLALGAKPSKPPVSLPMPPPPAVKPQPPQPPPEPPRPAEPPPPAKQEPPPDRERPLFSRIRVGAGLGPGFSLGSSASTGIAPQGSSPVWFRGQARATLDLMRVGPGDLQVLLPIAIQGAGFRMSVLGFLIQGSLFGLDVVPSVRYQAEVFPELSLYAELGLGFGTFQVTIQQQFVGYQTVSAGGLGVRMGGGVEYQLFDQLHLLLQPMELTTFTVTTTTTVNGMTVTSSTSASQWSLVLGAVVPLSL